MYALIYWGVSTVIASLIYSSMQFSLFLRVFKTAALWNFNSTLIGIGIFILTLKVPLGRFSKPAFFAIHMVAAVVSSTALVVMAFLSLYIYADPEIVIYINRMYPQFFHIAMTGYFAIAGWFYFLQFQQRIKEQAVREANFQKLSREAELKALKAQINPHFLFNTLNSINALVFKDPQKTRDMINRLADMLRYVLDGTESNLVSLREEMAFVNDYLEIEKTRWGDKLDLRIEVDEKLLGIPVPPIILQPLVENAVKHGVATQARGGAVSIEIVRNGRHLHCRVSDSGSGLKPEKEVNGETRGMGLRNIRDRLRCVYRDDFSLTIENGLNGGVIAEIVIPAGPVKGEL